jgi:hypothetical protein
MPGKTVGSVYVVKATKGLKTEYWAAATPMVDAVGAVRAKLPPGWITTLTDKRLTLDQAAFLRLRRDRVEKLKYRP